MKIISINSKETRGPQQVALDLDESWTPEYQKQLVYGSLEFFGEGRLLKVTIRYPAEDPFSEDLIRDINNKLAEISLSIADRAKNHLEMLEKLAKQSKLPLN